MKLRRLRTAVCVPDCHIPFHDPKAWAALTRAVGVLRPEYLIVLGDFVDCFSVSDHDKDPRRAPLLKAELAEGASKLDELTRLAPGAEKYFCKGNHENRLERFLWKRAPALVEMVTVEGALGLKARGWKVIPYREHGNIGKLFFTHDIGIAGIHAAWQTGQVFQGNVAFGHTHRLSVYYSGTVRGERHVAASMGWLGDVAAADYLPAARRAHWQHGFGVARFDSGGHVHLQPVPIVNGIAVLDGVAI